MENLTIADKREVDAFHELCRRFVNRVNGDKKLARDIIRSISPEKE